MPNSLAPAFVKINYQSAYSIHTMTVPTVQYNPPSPLLPSGEFVLRGALLPTAAAAAVTDYVNKLKPYFKSTVKFVDFTIFTQAGPTEPPTPRYTGGLNIVGTNASTGQDKAVQKTYTFRADDFSIFKIVMLDCPTVSFDIFRNSPEDPALTALINYVTAPETFIQSQKGGRPVTFLQVATTLNEKLRRAYRMT